MYINFNDTVLELEILLSRIAAFINTGDFLKGNDKFSVGFLKITNGNGLPTLELEEGKFSSDLTLFITSSLNQEHYFKDHHLEVEMTGNPNDFSCFIWSYYFAEFFISLFLKNGGFFKILIYRKHRVLIFCIQQDADNQELFKNREIDYFINNILNLNFGYEFRKLCPFGFRICSDIGGGDFRLKVFEDYYYRNYFEHLGCMLNKFGSKFKIVICGDKMFVEFNIPISEWDTVCESMKKCYDRSY